jgi:selenide,water dikinase
VLRQLPRFDDPNLLVGELQADDAAVYRLSDELALVQTVDFFTPIVDDPYLFGQIAAANSLSDVYAMGGTPRIALNITGFPVKSQPMDLLVEILRGGAAKASEAGVTIIGGHTIDDDEPKYGMAVTGTVDPSRVVTARGARPGDVLVLTKPIGTGLVSTALKAGAAAERDVAQAVRWMAGLNREASDAMLAAGASAATDISGFGLLGHLADMCGASGVSAVVDPGALPLLPGALLYARRGLAPGGTWTNLEYVQDRVSLDGVDEATRLLLCDPQTSGGLLVALPSERAAVIAQRATGAMLAARIGRVEAGEAGTVQVAQPLTQTA